MIDERRELGRKENEQQVSFHELREISHFAEDPESRSSLYIRAVNSSAG